MRRLIAGLVALVLVSAGCSVTFGSGDSASPSQSVSPSVRPKPSPPPDPVVVAAGDIQTYWEQQYPILYGDEYIELPLSNVFAAGKPGVTVPPCGNAVVSSNEWMDNAFYCFGDNYIAYDARPNGLIVELATTYGQPSVSAVVAHEWGHAVQDRAGNRRVPTVYAELQADCFSGAWVASAADDETDHFELQTGDLDSILSAMLAFRDAPGSSANAAGAHGSGFDRVSAFQDGYEEGPSECVPYFRRPPIITEIPFTTAQEVRSGGNVAARKVLPASVELLNDFYSKVSRRTYLPVKTGRVFTYDPADPPPSTDLPECGGEPIDGTMLVNRAFICHPDRYVIVDVVYMQRVYEEIGDFGVATLLAGPWATYVHDLQGVSGAGTEALAPAVDCYTGGFAAALVNGHLETKILGPVQASGGDLDEAIAAFIDADKVTGASGDEVFGRVEAFRDGFLEGYGGCEALLPTP